MLILLDIDGVMVPASSWKRPEFLNDGFPVFSSRAVKALQNIISETSANILLTTSHKSKYSIDEWKNIFQLRGLKVNSISSLPENLNFLNRKDEIMMWINSQIHLPDFLIIDDDKTLNSLPDFAKKNLLQTSSTLGLTEDLAKEYLTIRHKELHLS